MKRVKVGIIGGAGYTGGEAIRILVNHDGVELVFVHSNSNAGNLLSDVHADLLGDTDMRFTGELDFSGVDVIFLCVGHGDARKFLEATPVPASVRVIDLSQDFRLAAGAVLGERTFVYGLPEMNRELAKGKKLIANPGCYPTASTLGLQPMLKTGHIVENTIVIDAKSGFTGAGRRPALNKLLTEAENNFCAYALGGGHRHTPEIEQNIAYITGKDLMKPETWQYINFQPHLLPQVRGIEVTIYATCDKDFTNEEVYELYKDFYKDEPFVKVFPANLPVQTKWAYGTNFVEMTPTFDSRTHRLIVSSVIDNIGKGAAGQAIQNMNLIMGLPETTGLMMPPMYP